MLSPSDWERIKKSLLDHVVVTKGELDAEYQRVVDATKAWDKRNNLPALQAAIDQGQKELATAKQGFEAFRKTESERLAKWAEALKAQAESLAASVKSHNAEKTQLAADKDGLAASKSAEAKAIAAEREKLAKRAAEVDNLQASLHNRDVALTARESKVDSMISKLSAEWRA
jgi:hypothetical protein